MCVCKSKVFIKGQTANVCSHVENKKNFKTFLTTMLQTHFCVFLSSSLYQQQLSEAELAAKVAAATLLTALLI